MFRKLSLFLITLSFTMLAIVSYSIVSQKLSLISFPAIPSVSFSDLIKLSRYSLVKAPSQSMVGLLSAITGEVEYEPRLSTESAKVSSPREIQQGEMLTTKENGTTILTFNDDVQLAIGPNTKLSIIQTLPVNLVFAQTQGTIEYRIFKKLPVSVRSLHLLTEINGDIIMSVDRENLTVTTHVLSGDCLFAFNNLDNESQKVFVKSGQKIIFSDETRQVDLI